MAPLGVFIASSVALFSAPVRCEPQPLSGACATTGELLQDEDAQSFLQQPQVGVPVKHEQSLLQAGATHVSAKVSDPPELPTGRFAEDKPILPDHSVEPPAGTTPTARVHHTRPRINEQALLNPSLQFPLHVKLPDLPSLVPTPQHGAHGPHLTNDEAGRVVRLLQAADRLGSQLGLDRDSNAVQTSFAEAIQAIEVRRPKDVTEMVVNTYHNTVIRAIDLLERLPVEDASAQELSVTIDFLRAIHGLADVQESASGDVPGDMVQADMMAYPETLSLLRDAAKAGRRQLPLSRLWSDGHVPFCVAPSTSVEVRQVFADAIAEISSLVPCVTFEEVAWVSGPWPDAENECDAPKAVFLMSPLGSGCFANVGAPEGSAKTALLNLDPAGCTTVGVVIHEVLHIMGTFHEQQRGDRDDVVNVLWDNIKEDKQSNYLVSLDADARVDYDPFSIMHYGDTTFGKPGPDGNPLHTMEFNADSPYSGEGVMGQRFGMSQLDIEQLAQMYGCVGALITPCTYDQSQCTTGECTCPVGSIRTEAESGCHRCAEECPDAPSCAFNSDCACTMPAIKQETVSGDGDTCFMCHVPPRCPEDGRVTTEDTCACTAPLVRKSNVIGDTTYYRCAVEFEECPATPYCSADASCICSPNDMLKTELPSTSGGSCYSCHEECPDAPAEFSGAEVCTNDGGCPCAPGKVRSLLQVDGVSCVACRTTAARVTRNGCECKATWDWWWYLIQVDGTYCDDRWNICMPVDPNCELEAGNEKWYAYCANDFDQTQQVYTGAGAQ